MCYELLALCLLYKLLDMMSHIVICSEQTTYLCITARDHYLSGMNLNERELVQHVEYETDTYYASFSAEFEISCSPLWRLLVHCTDSSTNRHLVSILFLRSVHSAVCVNQQTPGGYFLFTLFTVLSMCMVWAILTYIIWKQTQFI